MGIKLTGLDSIGSLADTDLMHVVDVSDPTQDPAGSSKKVPMSEVFAYTNQYALQNTIPVTQANVATTLGGTIQSDKLYIIDGTVDLGAIEITVPPTGMQMVGLNMGLSGLTSSENNFTMFTDDSPTTGGGTIFLRDLDISVTGTNSRVFGLTDDTGFNALEMVNVNFNGCTSLGEVTEYRQLLEQNTGRFGGTPTLTLTGNMVGGYLIRTSIARGLSAGMTDPLYKAGTGLVINTRFDSNANIDLPASAAFVDFAPSNFANKGGLTLKGMRLTRGGVIDAMDANLTPNIDETEPTSLWTDNVGLYNNVLGGSLGVTSEAATVIVATSTFYPIAGTYAGSNLEHMSTPTNGRVRWDGQDGQKGRCLLGLDLDGTPGDILTVRVQCDRAAGGTDTLFSIDREVLNFTGGNDLAFVNRPFAMTLNDGDEVYMEVANTTAANNVTLKAGSGITLAVY